ncbi:50S ribosomal protein L14e [Clostridium sp. N3C]|nr:50S ribosomal protein L14e [Clostridium sp. N3C]
MNKEELLGRVVLSTAGRDSGKLYIIMDVIDDNYVLLTDGKLRPESKPKKKKLRHLRFTDIIAEEIKKDILSGKRLNDSAIRSFLQLNGI